MVLGLVCGNGTLPSLLLENNPNSFCALLGEGLPNISLATKSQQFAITQVPQMLNFFKENGVTHICLAGSIQKPQIGVKMFKIALAPLLFRILRLKNKGDNAILTTILNYITTKGFSVISATELLPSLLTNEGLLTKARGNGVCMKSINMACNFLADISKYDVAQACIVENSTITAIEGIDGTQAMISRMKHYNKRAILVKMPKVGQTLKIDMPTIGVETVRQCIEANVLGIVIKANQTIFLNQGEAIALANANNVFILSIA